MFKSNCHTHTKYCDGKNTAEEMIKRAVELDFDSIGFSGHSPMNFPNEWGMSQEGLRAYFSEITDLKDKYKDAIEVICGIELDSDFILDDEYKFDYAIGSVHQLHKGDKIYSLDLSPDELSECVRNGFGGKWSAMANAYFNSLADFIISEKVDVVGHFDLITKFNEGNRLFDETDIDYQTSAIKAIDRIIDSKPDIIFEVNTGAMYRCGNSKPYPAEFILKHIRSRNGKITITSDAHKTEALDFAFDKAAAYCKKCGFDEAYFITKNGFEATKI